MDYYIVSIDHSEFDSMWIVKSKSKNDSIQYVIKLIKSNTKKYRIEKNYIDKLES